jgi:hypothetical protein
LHHLSPSFSSHNLKQFLKVSLFHFIYVYKAHQPYSPSFILSIHPPPSHQHPPQHIGPILQSCPSFLILQSVFKGVSLYIAATEYTMVQSVELPPLLSFTFSLILVLTI